jgi:hypothetical protein
LVRASLNVNHPNQEAKNFLANLFTSPPKGASTTQTLSPPQCFWLPTNDSSFDFWTENHTFILLTTAALICDPAGYAPFPPTTASTTHASTTHKLPPNPVVLLSKWLNGHSFVDPSTGETRYFIFELNSPPYTTHTVECLLLLADFPVLGAPADFSSHIHGLATNILEQVINEIMAVSLCNGSWLSAAARMYIGNRLPLATEPSPFHTEIYDWIHGTLTVESTQDLTNWNGDTPLKSSYLAYALANTTVPRPSSPQPGCLVYPQAQTISPSPSLQLSLFGSPHPDAVKFPADDDSPVNDNITPFSW